MTAIPALSEKQLRSFWSRVRKTAGCWFWTGAMSGNHPAVTIGKVLFYAHRVAYELTHGPIPDGLILLHSCRRDAVGSECVNPAHLRPGTHKENAADRVAHRGR